VTNNDIDNMEFTV